MTMPELCECGRSKPSRYSTACSRCAYLDGTLRADMEIIAALRTANGDTGVAELAAATGLTPSGVWRAIQRLRRRARVTEYIEGDLGADAQGRGKGKRRVFALTARAGGE